MYRPFSRCGIATLMAIVLIGMSTPSEARPFTLGDLFATEGFGRVMVSPSGRWLVFERLGSYAGMPRHDMLMQHELLRSTPFVVDLAKPASARRLLGMQAGASTGLYGFSPDGNRIAIGRLSAGRWQLGVVTLATGKVRWWKLSPDYTPFARTLAWLSPTQLVVVAQRGGTWPWWLRDGHADGSPTRRRWAATRAGGPAAVTVVGSGRFLPLSPKPPAKDVFKIDVVNGRQTRLASGSINELSLSPDRRRLALIAAGPVVAASLAEALSPMTYQWRRRLLLLDPVDGRTTTPCATCDMAGSPQWSGDGQSLAIFARIDGQPWPKARLRRIDMMNDHVREAETFGVVPVVFGPPVLTPSVRVAWRGRELLVYGRVVSAADAPAEWFTIRGDRAERAAPGIADQSPSIVATASCATALVHMPDMWCLDGALPRRMGSDFTEIIYDTNGPVRAGLGVDRSSRIVWPDHPAFDRSIRIGQGERVDPASRALSAGSVLIRQRHPDGVSQLLLATGSKRTVLTTINAHLAQVQPASSIALHHRLTDGSLVTSWLLLPANAALAQRLPMIVIPYAGRSYDDTYPADQSTDSGTFDANAQLLVSRGYAVLLPSMPLLPVSDQAPFALAEQVRHAVDAALATGRIDPLRLALWGHSYGGYSAALIASETDRYKAVIASAGLYDLAAIAGVLTPASRATPDAGLTSLIMYGWLETGQSQMATQPWVDPARYTANSPFLRADRITAPLMLIAADWDISPVSQAEQMFGALYRQNKDAVLLTYWGEGHVVGSPANVKDLYERAYAFLSTNLDHSSSIVKTVGGSTSVVQ